MYFSKEMYPFLRCLGYFVLGGIIAAIFIRILDWQRIAQHSQQRPVGAEIGEERILPIQEEGDEEVRFQLGEKRHTGSTGLYHQTKKASSRTRGNPLRNLEEMVRTSVCSFLTSW